MSDVVEVDVLEWYGQAPDRVEIRNTIKAAQKDGLKLVDKDAYATTYYSGIGKGNPEEHHVVILYFAEKSSDQ